MVRNFHATCRLSQLERDFYCSTIALKMPNFRFPYGCVRVKISQGSQTLFGFESFLLFLCRRHINLFGVFKQLFHWLQGYDDTSSVIPLVTINNHEYI